jgi:LacI family transcriptional regulator
MKAALFPGKPPTILDVAKKAGVSKSTVSNVVRKYGAVSQEISARVLEAIEELGYRPNVLARQLVQQRTAIIGVIVGDFSNPFHAEMVKQIEQVADARGYRTMFVNSRHSKADQIAAIENLLDYRVAGLIFLAYTDSMVHIRRLIKGSVPTVFLTCRADWGDVVSADDKVGTAIATRHLVELGHKRIAYIADPIQEDAADLARQSGYLAVIAEAKLNPIVFHWSDTPETVLYERRKMPLDRAMRGSNSVTGIVSSNDFGAIKILDCADRLGIRVPDDLSVVGFDDVAISKLLRINLTTVAQPQERLVALTLETLAARIDGELVGSPVHHLLTPELVLRGTTAVSRPS